MKRNGPTDPLTASIERVSRKDRSPIEKEMIVTQHQKPIPPNSADPVKAHRIAEKSPDGVPDRPDAGPRTIGLFLAALVIGLLVVAVLLAAFVSPIVGIALGGLAFVFFLANPAVWAAGLRAEERRHVD